VSLNLGILPPKTSSLKKNVSKSSLDL